MSRSPSLRLERVSFAFDGLDPIFTDLTLHLSAGWVGIVGANGAGKTTLLDLVGGRLAPDGGMIALEPPGGLIASVCQRVDTPGAAVAALAARADAHAGTLRSRLALEPAALLRWATLSPGERRRWQLGAALAEEPDVLLVDEPSNHLDAEARAMLVDALAAFRGVGLIVSHDRALLDALTTATLLVEQGRARLYEGPWSAAAQLIEADRRALRQRVDALDREVRRSQRALHDAHREHASARHQLSTRARRKNAGDNEASSMLAKGRAQRGEAVTGRRVTLTRAALDRAREERDAIQLRPEYAGSIFLGWEPPRARRLLSLELDALRAGERVLADDVRLTLDRDMRVHLAGPNGAGKTTLIAAILAAAHHLPPERVLHLPQELTPDQEARLRLDCKALPPDARGRLFALLARLGVDPGRALAGDASSPGEARKLLLAAGLARHIWLAVLDEPTNHLDLPSIERLEAALADFPGALLLTSHDDAFAAALTSRRWTLQARRLDVN